VSISILTDDDKPLTGDAKTSFDSQNEAALCALKYLAEKYLNKIDKLSKQITSTTTQLSNINEEDNLKSSIITEKSD
jgi:hypothetical protein